MTSQSVELIVETLKHHLIRAIDLATTLSMAINGLETALKTTRKRS